MSPMHSIGSRKSIPRKWARNCGLSEGAVEAALAVLGARGLAGYDTTSGRYFHRVLPFDLERVEQHQPRLKNARELIDRVEIVSHHGADVDAKVPGSDFDHYVRLRFEGNKCTCRWHSRYQGQRGPCKHILAARMKVEGVDRVTIGEAEGIGSRQSGRGTLVRRPAQNCG